MLEVDLPDPARLPGRSIFDKKCPHDNPEVDGAMSGVGATNGWDTGGTGGSFPWRGGVPVVHSTNEVVPLWMTGTKSSAAVFR